MIDRTVTFEVGFSAMYPKMCLEMVEDADNYARSLVDDTVFHVETSIGEWSLFEDGTWSTAVYVYATPKRGKF